MPIEQVYDPDFDVYYLPNGWDGSGSGATDSGVQGLVNSVKNSKEEDRDTPWWNKIFDWFSRTFGVKTSSSPSLFPNGYTPSFSSSPSSSSPSSSSGSFASSSGDMNTTDVNAWIEEFKKWFEHYNQISESNAAAAQEFERQEAQKLREWQEYLSSTSYQRAVADMKKAGINPLLAFQTMSGASTPSGAMANSTYARTSSINPSSLLSSYASILGQNKNVASSFMQMLVKILSMAMLFG